MDGHCSHYTADFLQHARDNNIHILCYPSHSTHVYQGLDVAVFAPLKRHYQNELRDFERKGGGRVTKEIFMLLYSNAHAKAFVSENIRIAWAKTGVIPLNPNAIKMAIFKMSLETTVQPGTMPLRLIPSTPVRLITQLLTTARKSASSGTSESGSNGSQADNTEGNDALEGLRKSNVGFLLSDEDLTAESRAQLPKLSFNILSPGRAANIEAIRNITPITENERLLRNTMGAMVDKIELQGKHINTLEATMVLHKTYVDKLQAQLNRREKKSKARVRLLGDGLPVLLSGDEFYEKVKQHQMKREAEEKKKALAVEFRKSHLEEMKQWRELDEKRRERNKAIHTAFKVRLSDWQVRKDAAKAAKHRFTEMRPLRGKLEKPVPKPSRLHEIKLEGEEDGGEFFDLSAIGSDEDSEAECDDDN